jgi:hypothetical protein
VLRVQIEANRMHHTKGGKGGGGGGGRGGKTNQHVLDLVQVVKGLVFIT